MTITATGVTILAALVTFALGAAALALSGSRERVVGRLAALLPLALITGGTVATLLGHRPPLPELAAALPVAAGILTALLSRSLGYGLLAALVVAATVS